MSTQRFPYTPMPPYSGGMPVVKVGLVHEERSLVTPALVDSGAAMNVLPFEFRRTNSITITGNEYDHPF